MGAFDSKQVGEPVFEAKKQPTIFWGRETGTSKDEGNQTRQNGGFQRYWAVTWLVLINCGGKQMPESKKYSLLSNQRDILPLLSLPKPDAWSFF